MDPLLPEQINTGHPVEDPSGLVMSGVPAMPMAITAAMVAAMTQDEVEEGEIDLGELSFLSGEQLGGPEPALPEPNSLYPGLTDAQGDLAERCYEQVAESPNPATLTGARADGEMGMVATLRSGVVRGNPPTACMPAGRPQQVQEGAQAAAQGERLLAESPARQDYPRRVSNGCGSSYSPYPEQRLGEGEEEAAGPHLPRSSSASSLLRSLGQETRDNGPPSEDAAAASAHISALHAHTTLRQTPAEPAGEWPPTGTVVTRRQHDTPVSEAQPPTVDSTARSSHHASEGRPMDHVEAQSLPNPPPRVSTHRPPQVDVLSQPAALSTMAQVTLMETVDRGMAHADAPDGGNACSTSVEVGVSGRAINAANDHAAGSFENSTQYTGQLVTERNTRNPMSQLPTGLRAPSGDEWNHGAARQHGGEAPRAGCLSRQNPAWEALAGPPGEEHRAADAPQWLQRAQRELLDEPPAVRYHPINETAPYSGPRESVQRPVHHEFNPQPANMSQSQTQLPHENELPRGAPTLSLIHI